MVISLVFASERQLQRSRQRPEAWQNQILLEAPEAKAPRRPKRGDRFRARSFKMRNREMGSKQL